MADHYLSTEEVVKRIKEAMRKDRSLLKADQELSPAGGQEGARNADFLLEKNDLQSKLAEDFAYRIAELDAQKDINTEWQITSHRKLTGAAIVFAKNVVRNLLSWLIKPPSEQQSMINSNLLMALKTLMDRIEEDNRQIKKLVLASEEKNERESFLLQKKVEELESESRIMKG